MEERATIPRRTVMASAIGNWRASPLVPAITKPRKISWLAYARDESASGEKAARARTLFNLFSANPWLGRGDPIRKYLILASIRIGDYFNLDKFSTNWTQLTS